MICPTGKAENFSRGGWTRNSPDSPPGKSQRSVGRVEGERMIIRTQKSRPSAQPSNRPPHAHRKDRGDEGKLPHPGHQRVVSGLYHAMSEDVRLIVDRAASRIHRERHRRRSWSRCQSNRTNLTGQVGGRVDRQVSNIGCCGHSARDLLLRVCPAIAGRLGSGRGSQHGGDINCPGTRRHKTEALNNRSR